MSNTTPSVEMVLKAMASAARLSVLDLLKTSEKSVSEINGLVPLSQSALSQHMRILRDAGLVTTRRASQSIFYSLSVTGKRAIASAQFLAGDS